MLFITLKLFRWMAVVLLVRFSYQNYRYYFVLQIIEYNKKGQDNLSQKEGKLKKIQKCVTVHIDDLENWLYPQIYLKVCHQLL